VRGDEDSIERNNPTMSKMPTIPETTMCDLLTPPLF
jgi:hypothetical protein